MFSHARYNPFPGLLLGPLAWGLLFLASYLVSGTACTMGAEGGWLRVAIALMGGAASLVIILHALRRWRRRKFSRLSEDKEGRNQDFAFSVAFLLDCLSLAAVLMLMLNLIITPLCGS